MAVMQNSIIFGGIDSADYGIYISGEGVFNAPKRAVEMVAVPGRNGAVAVDQGYWENIEVTYPAFNYEEDMASFCQALSDFRNALASQKGYQRLSDTFHPDEYRMAVFSDGIEIKPVMYNTAANFDIVFDCKPQRWLTSGEDEVTVETGDVVTNPTLYDASPLLMVEGYGDISMNGYNIHLVDVPMGEIELVPAVRGESVYDGDYSDKLIFLENGDSMTLKNFSVELRAKMASVAPYARMLNATLTRQTNNLPNYIGIDTRTVSDSEIRKTIKYGVQSFTKQSANSNISDSYKLTMLLEDSGGNRTSYEYTFDLRVLNYGTSSSAAGKLTIDRRNASHTHPSYLTISPSITASAFMGDSTQYVLGHPTYIDCDLGEAYKEMDGQTISLNRYIDLGSDLPVLAPGTNRVTFENTITELKIVPRWWIL